MTYQELTNIATLVVVAVLTFWQTWRRWGNTGEVKKQSDTAKKFLGIKFARGLDGNWHLTPLPFHLRLALSLIPTLLIVIGAIYLQRLFALF
jgi:hypothetical protein